MTDVPHKILSASHLSYKLNGRIIIDDVTFEIRTGECFVIIGPNGAGKSTLLRLLSGIIRPGSGHVLLNGRRLDAYGPRERARNIAYVPQLASTDVPFCVKEMVMTGRAPHQGILGIEGRKDLTCVRDAMDLTDTGHMAGWKVSCLSGGERQRVLIAKALCQESPVLLMDEPTSALDPSHQIGIMDLMERLRADRSMTVVMVMHDVNLAAMYAGRVLVMKNGRLVVEGPTSEVLVPRVLEDVYECPMVVDKNPLGNVPRFMPVPSKFSKIIKKNV